MTENNFWPGWECVRQLGSGSFGNVYEIQKSEHGKVYKSALKIIRIPQNDVDIENAYSEGMDQNEVTEYFRSFVKNFSNEIALMSELKGYTNIVSYEDHMVIEHANKIGWDILIKMELLTPFPEWEKEHPLQEEDVIRLGCDICRALELCHKNKIIHRDIKPQNIFVNSNGDFKLGDFGIARVVEKTSSLMSQKGTYSYMAPEVFQGRPYNETADIYSLGIVLYRCLNYNRTPFLPLGTMNFSDRQVAQERRMTGEAIPEPAVGSAELKRVILTTLQYDSEKRMQSVSELRCALEQCKNVVNMDSQKNLAIPQISAIQMNESEEIMHVQANVDTEETLVVHSRVDIKENIIKQKNFASKKLIGVMLLLLSVLVVIIVCFKGAVFTRGENQRNETHSTTQQTEEGILEINCYTTTLLVGDSISTRLIYGDWLVDGRSKTIKWSIDDETIASIDEKGVLTAKTEGTCMLTAEFEGKIDSQKISVVGEKRDSGVIIESDCEKIAISSGGSDCVTITFSGDIPDKFDAAAYYSSDISLKLKWGKMENNTVTLTIEELLSNQDEGYITIFAYDQNNPEIVLASKKLYVGII